MNFPHIAYRTYLRLKGNPLFAQLIQNFTQILDTLRTPKGRARFIHREVDAGIKEIWRTHPTAEASVSCKQGCSACCHTQVSVTRDEAELLADRVLEGGIPGLSRLAAQKDCGDREGDWYKLGYKQRACVFLDEQGSCTVYEDRPSVCRTNTVFGPPADCSTEDGKTRPVRLLTTEKSDMALMAHFLHNRDNGTLPRMLHEALERRENARSKARARKRRRYPELEGQ